MNEKSIILVFGNDRAGVIQMINSLKDESRGKWELYDEERYQKNKKGFLEDLRESCLTKDLFLPDKTIYLKGEFLSESALKSFIEELPESIECKLIISYKELHPSRKKSLSKKVILKEFKKLYEREFKKWLKEEFNKRGKKITPDAIDYLTIASNSNKSECITEIDKLILYKLNSDIIELKTVKKLVVIENTNEWIANDIVSAFFCGQKKKVLSLLKQLSEQKKEIVLFEVLRESIRALMFSFLLFGEKERKEIEKYSHSYHSAINSNRFWDISKISHALSDLCELKIKSLPSSSPFNKVRQLMIFGIAFKNYTYSNICSMLDILCDFEVQSKNRLGFSQEGMELLFFRLWELK